MAKRKTAKKQAKMYEVPPNVTIVSGGGTTATTNPAGTACGWVEPTPKPIELTPEQRDASERRDQFRSDVQRLRLHAELITKELRRLVKSPDVCEYFLGGVIRAYNDAVSLEQSLMGA